MTDNLESLAMEKFAFVLMVIIAAEQKCDANFMASCEADHECPSGYYCYLNTNHCADCTNCQVVHRHNSTRTRCTKGYKECGECLSGFQEEILTNGKPRELCFPRETEEEEDKIDSDQIDQKINWNIMVLVAVFLLIIFIMMLMTVLTLNHVRKVYSRGNRQINHCEEPPPYSSLTPAPENPGNIGVDHRLVEEVIVNGRDRRRNEAAAGIGTSAAVEQSFSCAWAVSKEDRRLQEAVPFCQPTYACQNLNTSDHDSGVSELDSGSSEIPPDWHADLHDETTMPSDWTPNSTNPSENCEMDLDEGACTEATCERDGDDVYVDSQVSQTTGLMEQISSQQMMPSRSPQSECN